MGFSKSFKLGKQDQAKVDAVLPESRQLRVDQGAMEDWMKSMDRLIDPRAKEEDGQGPRQPWTGQVPLEDVLQTIDHELIRVGFDPLEDSAEEEATVGFASRFLVVRWQDQRAALPLENIWEIGTLEHWSPVPLTPAWLLGVTNVRGDILAVIDAGRLLGFTSGGDPKQGYLVLAKSIDDRVRTGLLVDGLEGIRTIADEQIQIPPQTDRDQGFISGLAATAGGAMPILALEAVFSAPGFLTLAETVSPIDP